MKLWNYAITALALFSMGSAYSNTSLTAGNRFTGGLLLQDTGYDIENDDSADVEGTFVVGGYKAALSPRFLLGGGVGIMLDGEIGSNNKADDGQGFRLFADLAFEAHRFGANKIIVTGTLSHDRFGFEAVNNTDVDFRVTELKGGGLFMHSVEGFDLYGGLELVLLSDGNVEVGNFDLDADRDDRLNLRLGANYNLSNYVALKADLLILGEQTLLLGADFAL